jgi:hypothetical protein
VSSNRWGSSSRSRRSFPSVPCRPSSDPIRATQDRARPSIQSSERPAAFDARRHRTNGSSPGPEQATPDLLLLASEDTGVGTDRLSSDRSRRSCRSREAQSGKGTRSRDMGTSEGRKQCRGKKPSVSSHERRT